MNLNKIIEEIPAISNNTFITRCLGDSSSKRVIDFAKRFVKKVAIVDDCWVWQGAQTNGGYGKTHLAIATRKYRKISAHRISFMLFKEDIPNNLTIDHKCKNTLCVNPDHLQLMTMRENILNSNGVSAINKAKTHCIRGHKFTPENTILLHRKSDLVYRNCRECYLNRLKSRYFQDKQKKLKSLTE